MVHLSTSWEMVDKSLIRDVTDPNNKLLEMVSLFYQQEVLEIAFWSTQLGPLVFCDNRLSSSFLFKAIKMSYWSLLSSLEMDTLIFDATLYRIYWNFSVVYIFFPFAPCDFVPSTFLLDNSICELLVCKWWKCYCLLFFKKKFGLQIVWEKALYFWP